MSLEVKAFLLWSRFPGTHPAPTLCALLVGVSDSPGPETRAGAPGKWGVGASVCPSVPVSPVAFLSDRAENPKATMLPE